MSPYDQDPEGPAEMDLPDPSIISFRGTQERCDQLERDRRLYLVTLATLLAYVLGVAAGTLGVVLAVTGRPAGLTLIAVALTVAAVAWGLHRAEETGP